MKQKRVAILSASNFLVCNKCSEKAEVQRGYLGPVIGRLSTKVYADDELAKEICDICGEPVLPHLDLNWSLGKCDKCKQYNLVFNLEHFQEGWCPDCVNELVNRCVDLIKREEMIEQAKVDFATERPMKGERYFCDCGYTGPHDKRLRERVCDQIKFTDIVWTCPACNHQTVIVDAKGE